jgi:hypothetical protein
VRLHVVLASLAAFVAACSLLVSTDGLDDGATRPDAAPSDAPASAGDGAASGDASNADGDAAPSVADTYRATVLGDTPLSYWRFGETSGTIANDETGAHPGTYASAFTLGAPGVFAGNGSVDLAAPDPDDAGSVVIGPVYDFVGHASFSVEAWVFPKHTDGEYRNVYTKCSASPRTGHFLWVRGDGLAVERNHNFFGDGGVQEAAGSQSPLELSAWSYVVVTYDGTSLRMYVNASLVDTAASSASLEVTPNPFRIGGAFETGSPWIGSIDEVAVYDKTLSAETVSAHYKAAGR